MTTTMAKYLKSACDEMGEECDIYNDYSGRAMYGSKTTGVVVDSLISLLNSVLEYGEYADQSSREKIDWTDLVADSMGLGTIVY